MDTSEGIILLIPWSLTKEINIQSIINTLMCFRVKIVLLWGFLGFFYKSQLSGLFIIIVTPDMFFLNLFISSLIIIIIVIIAVIV